MKRIISVSRRTDIPAFYGEWFMRRLKAGFAAYTNPFSGEKLTVSLRPEDVIAFVFWSKNFAPFLDTLGEVERLGYRFCFNFTITGLPRIFEVNVVETAAAVHTLKELSRRYSLRHINWRYDPVVISDITGHDWHLIRFRELASELEGHVERCCLSFPARYAKVERSFAAFERAHGIRIHDPGQEERIELAEKLAEIGRSHGMRLHTCCGDYLISSAIEKAHCVDGRLIEELFGITGLGLRRRPTRRECGCTESTDIGAYDTCPHGCVYCYANSNKEAAARRHKEHDPGSEALV